MSRHVANAGAFYSYFGSPGSRGCRRLCRIVVRKRHSDRLCGLFGAAFADFAKATFGIDLAWWIWSFLALILIASLGVLRIDVNAAVLLGLECSCLASTRCSRSPSPP